MPQGRPHRRSPRSSERKVSVAAGAGLCPAGGEERVATSWREGGGSWGNPGFPHALAAILQLVPRGDRSELEQRPTATGVLVGELGLALVPDDLERTTLDLVVEPGAAEEQLA